LWLSFHWNAILFDLSNRVPTRDAKADMLSVNDGRIYA
jgi:hypothetical protein